MAYADQVKGAKKKDVRVTIETADNGGVIVSCCYCGMGMSDGPSEDKKLVYENLEDALKEIPSLISMKQDMDENDPVDKKMMEED